jgi:hypothetical protein
MPLTTLIAMQTKSAAAKERMKKAAVSKKAAKATANASRKQNASVGGSAPVETDDADEITIFEDEDDGVSN